MRLRDYQAAAVESIFDYFELNSTGNPIVAMPTGTGKSVVIGAFIKEAMQRYPSTRVMKLTHVKELILQNFEKLLAIWPTAPAGVYSAGLGRKDAGYPILFGGIASVARGDSAAFGRVDLLLIDECHLVSPKVLTQYQKVITKLLMNNPSLRVVGFTATPYRAESGMLTEGNGLFTDVCFDMTTPSSFNWLLEQGYLSLLIPKRTQTELDVSGVRSSGGEYRLSELQATVDKDSITYAALRETLSHGQGRLHWLIFATGIEHAQNVASMLNSLGVTACCVHSLMGASERDAHIAAYRDGHFQAMVNNGVLTTGFDFPAIDLIVMLRPTQSPGLWVQMLGRGMRPVYSPEADLSTTLGRLRAIEQSQKQNCLVLDFAGNTRRLGPVNDPVLPLAKGPSTGKGQPPVKLCAACSTYNHAGVRFCVGCEEEFPRFLHISAHAGTEELIATAQTDPPVIFRVDRVVYKEHQKGSAPPSLQVTYFCGLRMFREWLCFEHAGYPRRKAREWWRECALQVPPSTTGEALARLNTLRTPLFIKVRLKKAYADVVAHDYTGVTFGGD